MNLSHSESELSLIQRYAGDILASEGMQQEKGYTQHGTINCYEHSVSVACMSIKIASHLPGFVDEKSLIRGALLHDYFLYDWHEADSTHKLHGFTHAKCALENAEKDFHLTDVERDIISKHMFPLNPAPPRCRESMIVTVADKICSAAETMHGIFRHTT